MTLNIHSVRYSLSRKQEFQIKTVIYEENNEKKVLKQAYNKTAQNHINNIYNNYHLLKEKSKQNIVDAQMINENIAFPFIEGESLINKLLAAVKEKNKEQFIEYIMLFKNIFLDENRVDFKSTERFLEIFGEEFPLDNTLSFEVSNIDINFENIFINSKKELVVIDYEWVYDFPIPEKFVYYRVIFLFINNYYWTIKGFIDEKELYELFKISAIEKSFFEKMQNRFHKYVSGGWSLEKENYKKEVFEQEEILSLENNEDTLQIFWGKNNQFNEEDSVLKQIRNSDAISPFKISILDQNVDSIRIDPGSKISYAEIEILFRINGDVVNSEQYFIQKSGMYILEKNRNYYKVINFNNDPQLYFYGFPNFDELTIEINLKYINESKSLVNILNNYLQQNKRYFNETLLKKQEQLEKVKTVLNNKDLQIEELQKKMREVEKKSEEIKKSWDEDLSNLLYEKEKYERFYIKVINTKGWRFLEFFRKILNKSREK